MSAMSSLFGRLDSRLARPGPISWAAPLQQPAGLPGEPSGSCSGSPITEFCDPNCSREANGLSYKACGVGSDHAKAVKADDSLQAACSQILREFCPC